MVSAEGWLTTKTPHIDVPVIQTLTFKFTLLIIAGCGFGIDSFTWNEPPAAEDGSMTVQHSLQIVSQNVLFAIAAPKWSWMLPVKWYVHYV